MPATPRGMGHKGLEKLVSREGNDTERRTGMKNCHRATSDMEVEGDTLVGHDLQKVQLGMTICP